MTSGFREKAGSILEAAKRALGANSRVTGMENMLRQRSDCRPAPRALSHRGSLAGTLAREEGSNPNNPYALYTPGRYIRGC